MNSRKSILFYSSFCQFSKDVVNYIIKKDLKPQFVFISVDTKKHMIPQQVDKVPALLDQNTGKLYFEDNIIAFINSLVQDIMPLEQPSSNYSENFSFLDNDNSPGGLQNFALYGQEQRIYTPEEDGGSKNENGSVLDSIKSQRDVDVQSIFGDRRTMG